MESQEPPEKAPPAAKSESDAKAGRHGLVVVFWVSKTMSFTLAPMMQPKVLGRKCCGNKICRDHFAA